MADAERPHVLVYDLHHLISGVSFNDAAIDLSNPENLQRRAEKRLALPPKPDFLVTKGGLVSPILAIVDGSELSFHPGVYVDPFPRHWDAISYAQELKQNGDLPLPEELRGRNFEIWTMSLYPGSEQRFMWEPSPDSPLFDPKIDVEAIGGDAMVAYFGIIDQEKELENRTSIALGWYTRRHEQFRLATRPHKWLTASETQLTVHGTLPNAEAATQPQS